MSIACLLECADNPLVKGFIQTKSGKELTESFAKNPSKANRDRLNEAFKIHYIKIKSIAYFSKVIAFEAKHYDKRRRKIEGRFSLVLDAPVSGEEELTMKDAIKDDTQDTSGITPQRWEDEIRDDNIRSVVESLTDKQKDTINYSFFQGLKDKEIAKKLGVTPQSVSKTKKAAINKIRRELSVG